MNPSEHNGNANNKYLQDNIEVLAPHLHHLEVSVDDGWEDDEHEGGLHKEIVGEQLNCLVGEVVLFFNNESLVG